MQIRTTMNYHLLKVRMGIIKKQETARAEEKGAPVDGWRWWEPCGSHGEQHQAPQKAELELPHGPAPPHLGYKGNRISFEEISPLLCSF